MRRVEVSEMVFDAVTNIPIVILKDAENRELPIWIGIAEAQAIMFALEEIKPPRPMTHDLLKEVVVNLGGELKHVLITHIINNTYYAKLVIQQNNDLIEIDSRPSDGIALALRTSSPIFVDNSIKFIESPQHTKPITDEELKKFKEDLKNL